MKRSLSLGLVLVAAATLPLGADEVAVSGIDGALAAVSASLEAAPRDPALLNDYGNLLVRAGRLAEARTAYESAIAAAPGSTLPLYDLGLLELEQGRPADAAQRFRRALDLDPGFARAEYGLGAALQARGRSRRAVKHYVRAFELAPELIEVEHNPEILFNTLATWASTSAYLGHSVGRGTRLYANPQPIASLLLPVGDAVPTPPPEGPPAAAAEE